MVDKKQHIVVAGAGLVGSLLAIFLCRRGYRVTICERRGDMRKTGAAGGRSINLALSDRGIRALEKVGIMDEIRPICIPMHGRHLHQPDGSQGFQPYGESGQFINSVSRAELNKKLIDLAERSGATIKFDHACEKIDWKKNEIALRTSDGGTTTITFDRLLGADGAYSACRWQHQSQHERFQYSQYYIDYGYRELTIPPGPSGEFLLEMNALHIWPRGNYMLIALPNVDGSFTCTLFFPFEGDPSFATLDTVEKMRAFFSKTFPDVLPLMPDLDSEFFTNPTSSLVTVKCFPWIRGERFALIGDAAHAMVPFFGQGMNCGFEDCLVLDELLEKNSNEWKRTLEQFQLLRKPDADAIAEMALNNFVEMRDRVADPKFLLQKKIEARLHEKFPDKWIPAYSQVTFNPGIRYSEAQQRGRAQEAIMQKVMQHWQSEADVTEDDLDKIIAQL